MAESDTVVVVDTSVMINLNASGRAADILDALPFRIVVTDIVAGELQEDRRSGRQDATLLGALVQGGRIGTVSLGDAALDTFATLVVGPAGDTLDDGEAATIAYAVEAGIPPVLDERKALRIYAARFAGPRVLSTVDLFAAAAVEAVLGRPGLGDAVFRSLQTARMRVAAERLPWVVALIGAERARNARAYRRAYVASEGRIWRQA
jgi:predicted nucleic acid-binding protein